MLWKCCTQYASKFGKLSSGHRTEKVSFIPISKKGNARECSNYCTIALISHTSKVTLKILQGRLQQYVNHELPDVQPAFRKGSGTRDQIANIHSIIEKAREFQKNIYCFIHYAKPLTVWITINCGKCFKRWEYQTTWPASWEICMQVKKQQLQVDMSNRLVPNWERSMSRLYIVTLLNLHAEYIMGNARLDEAQAGIKIAGRNINNISYAEDHPYGRKRRRAKEPLDEHERGEWKSWLKTQHSEN